jgi:hypothetical protein
MARNAVCVWLAAMVAVAVPAHHARGRATQVATPALLLEQQRATLVFHVMLADSVTTGAHRLGVLETVRLVDFLLAPQREARLQTTA